MTNSSAETDAWSRTSAPGAHETGVQRQGWRAYFEATALLQDRLDRTLKESAGLHLADYNLLLLLSEAPEGRLRMGELARLMVFSPSRVTYQVKTLEQRGLVERQPDPRDRRSKIVAPTGAGRELYASAKAAVDLAAERSLGDLRPQDREDLARLLRQVAF